MSVPSFPPRFDTDHMKPFYEGLEAGELRITACGECGRWYWYPPELLPCHPQAHVEWRAASPTGRVYMFSTVHRRFLPGDTTSELPFTVAMVEPDDAPGVRVPGALVGLGDRQPACDMRVRFAPVRNGGNITAAFTPIDDGETA